MKLLLSGLHLAQLTPIVRVTADTIEIDLGPSLRERCPTCQGRGSLTPYEDLCRVADEVDFNERLVEAIAVALSAAKEAVDRAPRTSVAGS